MFDTDSIGYTLKRAYKKDLVDPETKQMRNLIKEAKKMPGKKRKKTTMRKALEMIKNA